VYQRFLPLAGFLLLQGRDPTEQRITDLTIARITPPAHTRPGRRGRGHSITAEDAEVVQHLLQANNNVHYDIPRRLLMFGTRAVGD
jgi:hypothetical protein